MESQWRNRIRTIIIYRYKRNQPSNDRMTNLRPEKLNGGYPQPQYG